MNKRIHARKLGQKPLAGSVEQCFAMNIFASNVFSSQCFNYFPKLAIKALIRLNPTIYAHAKTKKSNPPHLCILHYLCCEKLVSSSHLRFASTKACILFMLPLVELPRQHGASATESLVRPHLPVAFKM